MTFVAIDIETKRPTPVPPLILETDEERAEHGRALERRRLRLERRKLLPSRAPAHAGFPS